MNSHTWKFVLAHVQCQPHAQRSRFQVWASSSYLITCFCRFRHEKWIVLNWSVFRCVPGSVTFWYGFGCGSVFSDPYLLCLTDPGPGGTKTYGSGSGTLIFRTKKKIWMLEKRSRWDISIGLKVSRKRLGIVWKTLSVPRFLSDVVLQSWFLAVGHWKKTHSFLGRVKI